MLALQTEAYQNYFKATVVFLSTGLVYYCIIQVCGDKQLQQVT